jgi:hypothetical protein
MLSPVAFVLIESTMRFAVGASSLVASPEPFLSHGVGGLASRLPVLSLPPSLASSGVPFLSLDPLERAIERGKGMRLLVHFHLR